MKIIKKNRLLVSQWAGPIIGADANLASALAPEGLKVNFVYTKVIRHTVSFNAINPWQVLPRFKSSQFKRRRQV